MRHILVRFISVFLIIVISTGSSGMPVEAKQLEFMGLDQTTQTDYVPGQLVVKFKPHVANLLKSQRGVQGKPAFRRLPALDRLSRRYDLITLAPVFDDSVGIAIAQGSDLSQIYLLTVPSTTDIWQMAADYRANPDVVYAEPNYIAWLPDVVAASSTGSPELPGISAIFPDDPAFIAQYGL
ncbi:MAG: hypothetical protein L0Y56_21770, partial [Nitrospira sp.]|nr:hypothetical protein [Nitrospira sp.]